MTGIVGESIDLGGGVATAEAIVDVGDGDSAAARIEHSQQGGETAEVGTVADAGGDGDDGTADEAGDDAGEGTFHAGDDDQHIGIAKEIHMSKQAMEAGDTDVEQALDCMAHELGGNGGFLGHWQVAGAGAEDRNVAMAFGERRVLESDATSLRVVYGFAIPFADRASVFRADASDEDPSMGLVKLGRNFFDLLGRFTGAEDDFGKPFACGPFQIDLGKAKIYDGWKYFSDRRPFGDRLRGALVSHARVP